MTHLRGLDGVRALACLIVFAHHTLSKLPESNSLGTQLAYEAGIYSKAGVSAFFVLSGFLLSLPYWQSLWMGTPRPSSKQYLLRRFARIMPAYYVCLAVTTVVCVLYFSTAIDGQLVLRLVTAFTFTNSFHPVTLFPADINGPLWSIGFEVVSYMLLLGAMLLLFKLGAKWSYRTAIGFWLVILLIDLVAHMVWQRTFPAPTEGLGWEHGIVGYARTWVPHTNPFALFSHFALGVLAGAFSVAMRSRVSASLKMDALSIGLSMLLVLASGAMFYSMSDAFEGLFKNLYLWPIFPLFVGVWLVLLPKTTFFAWVLEFSAFRFIAKISFGIYIWHMFIIETLRLFVFPSYQYHGTNNLLEWAEITLLALILSIIAATVSWYVIEQPVLKWASSKGRAPQVPLATAPV